MLSFSSYGWLSLTTVSEFSKKKHPSYTLLGSICAIGQHCMPFLHAETLHAGIAYTERQLCHFISQPVHSHNAYDADTEPPSVEDTLISSITDPELRSELTCEQYITRLRNGAWGDHIALQVIADIFSVTINVLSTRSGSMILVVPRDGSAHCQLYVGLIMQY